MIAALLLLVICTPDHPTPTVKFDPSATEVRYVAGYSLLMRQPGGTGQVVYQMPMEQNDLDEDGTLETIFRRGVELDLPPFKFYQGSPNTLYEFAVSAYSVNGTSAPSNWVQACRPVYCVRGMTCN